MKGHHVRHMLPKAGAEHRHDGQAAAYRQRDRAREIEGPPVGKSRADAVLRRFSFEADPKAVVRGGG